MRKLQKREGRKKRGKRRKKVHCIALYLSALGIRTAVSPVSRSSRLSVQMLTKLTNPSFTRASTYTSAKEGEILEKVMEISCEKERSCHVDTGVQMISGHHKTAQGTGNESDK